MSELRVHNLVVSLDGFATGEGQSPDAAFGHAQQAFMETRLMSTWIPN